MKNFIIFSLILCQSVFAVPSLINYQGRLTDPNGDALTGNKIMSVSIYDAATEGTSLYTEEVGIISLDSNGIYSFSFGTNQTALTSALQTTGEHWLELTVDGTSQTPRERILSVPFAQMAHSTPLLETKVISLLSQFVGLLDTPLKIKIDRDLNRTLWTGGTVTSASTIAVNGYIVRFHAQWFYNNNGSVVDVIYEYEDGSEVTTANNLSGTTGAQDIINPFPSKKVANIRFDVSGSGFPFHSDNARDTVIRVLDSRSVEISTSLIIPAGNYIVGVGGTHSRIISTYTSMQDRHAGGSRLLGHYNISAELYDEEDELITSINLNDSPTLNLSEEKIVTKVILSYAPNETGVKQSYTTMQTGGNIDPYHGSGFLRDINFIRY